MWRVGFALLAILVVGAACAQEASDYPVAENPFQGDYPFALGEPVNLHVTVLGVRLDEVRLATLAEMRPGEKVKCEIFVLGSNTTDKPVTVTTVLLLEDAQEKPLERISLSPAIVKAKKPLKVRQVGPAVVDALLAARKVYLFISVEPAE
jgi:hypothetical protein